MKSPTGPSFKSIGLEKLQVLDLSWISITTFANDTFKGMTSLLSLDVRGNYGFVPVTPDGLFVNLINLRTLLVEDAQFSFKSSRNFVGATQSLKSLDSFVFLSRRYKIWYSNSISINKSYFARIKDLSQ